MKPTGKVKIQASLNPALSGRVPFLELNAERLKRLDALYDLPVQFGVEHDLKTLFQLIVDKVTSLIPAAERSALLVYESESGKLALRASIPPDEPAISRTLIQRTVSDGWGFIWRRDEEQDVSASVMRHGMECGMYAPLLWDGEVQGVLCVDNRGLSAPFREEDLKFLMTIAHYAASAVANHQMRADIEHNALVMRRLLTNFSPQIRDRLVQRAKAGGLEPGGEKSEVTILFSDIRGFTQLTSDWDAEAVVELLNDYFALLVEAIFENGGTIDKFIGDGILTVFGSPEPDPDHQINAVKAAMAMQEAMRVQNSIRQRKGLVQCEIGIGVHTGVVLHGFIGALERLEFTVIGEAVNKTSRYCDAAKGGEVLLSEALYSTLNGQAECEERVIPTKHEGDLKAFKVVALNGD